MKAVATNGSSSMRYIGVDIPETDFTWLEERKWQERTSIADLVRTAIAEYRERHEQPQPAEAQS